MFDLGISPQNHNSKIEKSAQQKKTNRAKFQKIKSISENEGKLFGKPGKCTKKKFSHKITVSYTGPI